MYLILTVLNLFIIISLGMLFLYYKILYVDYDLLLYSLNVKFIYLYYYISV